MGKRPEQSPGALHSKGPCMRGLMLQAYHLEILDLFPLESVGQSTNNQECAEDLGLLFLWNPTSCCLPGWVLRHPPHDPGISGSTQFHPPHPHHLTPSHWWGRKRGHVLDCPPLPSRNQVKLKVECRPRGLSRQDKAVTIMPMAHCGAAQQGALAHPQRRYPASPWLLSFRVCPSTCGLGGWRPIGRQTDSPLPAGTLHFTLNPQVIEPALHGQQC